jgi:hypothetical protein
MGMNASDQRARREAMADTARPAEQGLGGGASPVPICRCASALAHPPGRAP